MQKKNEKNIIFLSELGHIDILTQFLEKNPTLYQEGFLIIPLDVEVEYALKEKNISFLSGREYRTPDFAPMVLAEDWTASVLESERWSFFTYRGVLLSRLYFLPLHWYTSHVLYYGDIVSNVLMRHVSAETFIFFNTLDEEPMMGGTLVMQQVRAMIDVLTSIVTEKGKKVSIFNSGLSKESKHTSRLSFTVKRALFGIGITILNNIITLTRRPRATRILASDYWKYLEPYVKRLDSAEVILIDRKEALNAGFSNIWKFRMRFLHVDAFSEKTTIERTNARERIMQEWFSIKEKEDLPLFQVSGNGVSLRPIIVRALERIVDEAVTKVLRDIDGAHMMCERLKPDLIELKSTISAQTHFIILAQVARARGVPSLEIQHGLEYYGPGSFWRRHSAEYMGVYGSFVQKEMEAVGDLNSTPIVIGSPRFDVYASLQKEMSVTTSGTFINPVSFLCIAPAIGAGGDFDTYDAEEYYKAVAFAVKKIPNARVVIKLRPGPNRDLLVRSMFASFFEGVSYTVAQLEPFSELFRKTDIIISCYSTVVLEALASGKPMIFLGLYPSQKMMGLHHFTKYAEQGALKLATTEEELVLAVEELGLDSRARTKLVENCVAFLDREYAFDGKASERTAELIKALVTRREL